MARVYEDKPLNVSTSTNIRLIQIDRDYASNSDGKHTISCKMLVVSVDSEIQYNALSYMWGDPTCKQEILLDGKPFLVTSNLFDFLEVYSKGDEEDLLWIDAMCINQENTTERNHQVALMGRIYFSARRVLVWLGKGDVEILKEMQYVLFWVWRRPSQDQNITIERDAKLKMVRRIWMHSYWTRAWIRQEFILSRSFSVRCGPTSILGSEFQHFFQDTIRHLPSATPVAKLLEDRMLWRGDSRFYVYPWQTDYKAGCSDIRDRIYSMIALMDPATGISPDYNKTKSELFIDITSSHLNQEWSDKLLGLVRNLLQILEINVNDDKVQTYLESRDPVCALGWYWYTAEKELAGRLEVPRFLRPPTPSLQSSILETAFRLR